MKRQQRRKVKHDLDVTMRTIVSTLVRDFQVGLKDFSFCCSLSPFLYGGSVAEIRHSTPAVDFTEQSAAKFKRIYQVNSILKRYRFKQDLFTDEQLIESSIKTFMETQQRIATIDFHNLDANTRLVVELAKRYVAKLLGPYSDEEHRSSCRFGKKASVGIPARLACEAARWELPLSGSLEQISWFDSEMSQIEAVQEYWNAQREADPNRSTYQETDSLTLALVPKSFKALRSIMPNTTIGSYMSFGLGEMMRIRLKRKGYDIKRLQMRHRYLARRASSMPVNGYTTCDLSSASDSISVALVRELLPADWFEILNKSRIGKVTLPDGSSVESETFCTMGIGYTFPLQTIIFLSLLKAIQAVNYPANDRRLISVYGDDMIYRSSMHPYVIESFNKLGFVINIEKSYHEGFFRESCGGDYFRGVDVRPFQPQNGPANVGDKAYEATLYKLVNGLLYRWHECEIPETLTYLSSELMRCAGHVKVVPPDHPDDSGVKIRLSDAPSFLGAVKVAKPKHIGHGMYRFSYLKLVPEVREEVRHAPYVWLATRRRIDDFVVQRHVNNRPDSGSSKVSRNINLTVGLPERKPLLQWKESGGDSVRLTTGRRTRRLAAYVTISHTGRYTRQSGVSCFELRS